MNSFEGSLLLLLLFWLWCQRYIFARVHGAVYTRLASRRLRFVSIQGKTAFFFLSFFLSSKKEIKKMVVCCFFFFFFQRPPARSGTPNTRRSMRKKKRKKRDPTRSNADGHSTFAGEEEESHPPTNGNIMPYSNCAGLFSIFFSVNDHRQTTDR